MRRGFTDGKPRVATEKECNVMWSGGESGRFFHCYLCGHQFQVGDTWRWVYSNGTNGAGGNPFVCDKCDGSNEEVIAKWAERVKDVRWGSHRAAARLWAEEY